MLGCGRDRVIDLEGVRRGWGESRVWGMEVFLDIYVCDVCRYFSGEGCLGEWLYGMVFFLGVFC